MFLYVVLSALLCISFSSGFTTSRLYPGEITKAPEPVPDSGHPGVNPFPDIAETSEPRDDSGVPTENPLPEKAEVSKPREDSGVPTENPLPEKAEESKPREDSSVPTENPLPEKAEESKPREDSGVPTENPLPEKAEVSKPREDSGYPTENPLPEKAEVSKPREDSGYPTENPLPEKAEVSKPREDSGVPTENPLPEKAEVSKPREDSGYPTENPLPEKAETSEPITNTEAAATTTTPIPETPEPSNFIIEKSNSKCSSSGTKDGVLEIGCWGYKKCVEGSAVTYWCPNSTKFARDSFTCVRSGSESSACTTVVSCVNKLDGWYAHVRSGCQSFTLCLYNVNYGQQYCPANLIFNEEISGCDYPYNVAPPCGTKVLQK